MKNRVVIGALALSFGVAFSLAHERWGNASNDTFRLIALGQALIRYDLRQYARPEFELAIEYLKGADVCFSNLDVAIEVPASG